MNRLLHGFLPDGRLAWSFLIAWLVAVVVYALWRSLGEAPQDPIRPSGPI